MITIKQVTAFAYLSFGIGAILGYHILLSAIAQGDLNTTAFWLGLLVSGCAIFLTLHLQINRQIKPRVIKPVMTVAPTTIHYITLSSLHNYPNGQYVYVIQDVDVTGLFKIGRTNNPEKRILNFGVHLPFNVGIVHIIPTDNMCQLEAQLHRRFASKRVRGEWFQLDATDLEAIRGLA